MLCIQSQAMLIQLQIQPPAVSRYPLTFAPGSGAEDGAPKPPRPDRNIAEGEELPFKVELWNEQRDAVEQVLAVTANGSIGYAAYYAATREFADRYVTLRHKNRIVSRWNGPNN
jgi:hypothetical protein